MVNVYIILEMVAVAMHCNLRPPDIMLIIMGYNHEAQNTLTYKSIIPLPP